ncbi:methionyl-tRNA formyltransferase [Salidesulfovibrio onnuriiensis]|uniref:methionyl-tRNA formyltransferase n=1 Tax=Salidesulfovibrio onnuriiensis TaxID=2583823 RepID=UPI00164FD419|nr:formyltransferase family protein [Salidesulfovibrio onnuriiensis]
MESGFPNPLIMTHPRDQHVRDATLLTSPELYKNVFETAERLGLRVFETSTVNTPDSLEVLREEGVTAGFSLSCRSIIKRDFIRAVNGFIFNIHPSMLPAERGGGTFSWRILNNSKEVSATVHVLDEGIDTGAVIVQKRTELEKEFPTPHDYLVGTNRVYLELLREFLSFCRQGAVPCHPQSEEESTYLPRLYTEQNGAIDWNWSDVAVERFIRAFGAPYPGAFTYAGERRFHIPEARLEPLPRPNHPFLKGRVVGFTDKGEARVFMLENMLVIPTVVVDGQSLVSADFLSVNTTLHTPWAILAEARTAVPKVASMTSTPGKVQQEK